MGFESDRQSNADDGPNTAQVDWTTHLRSIDTIIAFAKRLYSMPSCATCVGLSECFLRVDVKTLSIPSLGASTFPYSQEITYRERPDYARLQAIGWRIRSKMRCRLSVASTV
jgi:hypothetical protein